MMRKNLQFFLFVPVFAAALLSGCRSAVVPSNEPDYMTAFNPLERELPGGFRFRPEPVPDLAVPPDVGTLSEYPPANQNDSLISAFTDAYKDALLRGLSLKGVLGGDRVHPWPDNNPQGRIQNWTSGGGEMNSWGFPGLTLAIGNAEEPDEAYMVYTVSGGILDRYGRSPGPNIGNGIAGYGYPVGEMFFREGSAFQYFSRGSIEANAEGSVFLPGAVPGMSKSEDASDTADEIARVFSALSVPEELAGRSDGPVISIVFPEPWIIAGQAGGIPVTGVHIKSYDTGNSLFVFVDSPVLPRRARFLTGSFLNILLRSEERIPGSENESPEGPAPVAGSSYTRALFAGFSVYGVPLSNSLPVTAGDPEQAAADGSYDETAAGTADAGFAAFQETQRFSRGWIIAPPVPRYH
ncbi:MAG: hypothetical protein LBI67_11230 [Treponema sp.]|jgi:hypothetical protein|nr:hypothetical protein [Treponema sp.]